MLRENLMPAVGQWMAQGVAMSDLLLTNATVDTAAEEEEWIHMVEDL